MSTPIVPKIIISPAKFFLSIALIYLNMVRLKKSTIKKAP
jgi:hypothetical protein